MRGGGGPEYREAAESLVTRLSADCQLGEAGLAGEDQWCTGQGGYQCQGLGLRAGQPVKQS